MSDYFIVFYIIKQNITKCNTENYLLPKVLGEVVKLRDFFRGNYTLSKIIIIKKRYKKS